MPNICNIFSSPILNDTVERRKKKRFTFYLNMNIFDGVTPISERNEQTLTFLFVHSQFSYLEIVRFSPQNGFCLLAKF